MQVKFIKLVLSLIFILSISSCDAFKSDIDMTPAEVTEKFIKLYYYDGSFIEAEKLTKSRTQYAVQKVINDPKTAAYFTEKLVPELKKNGTKFKVLGEEIKPSKESVDGLSDIAKVKVEFYETEFKKRKYQKTFNLGKYNGVWYLQSGL